MLRISRKHWHFVYLAVGTFAIIICIIVVLTKYHALNRNTSIRHIALEKLKTGAPGTFLISDSRNTPALLFCDSRNKQGSTFLTLFTTFAEEKQREIIQHKTLMNLKSLPRTKVLVFTNSKLLHQQIDGESSVQTCAYNKPNMGAKGRPVLKEMFITAQNASKSVFYGYTNGDIIFHKKHLLLTLLALQEFIQRNNMKKFLVTGRRTNIILNESKYGAGVDVTDDVTIEKLAVGGDVQPPIGSYDVFITAHGSFSWEKTPQFIVGAPLFDSWLVGYCVTNQIPVFDVTSTLTHLHVSMDTPDIFANKKNRTYSDENMRYNSLQWSKGGGNVKWIASKAECAHYRTIRDDSTNIIVVPNVAREKYPYCL